MIEPTVAPVARELHVDEINWTLTPPPAPPAMSRDEMIVEAAIDSLSYRLLVCEALDQLHKLTGQIAHLRESNQQLRASREVAG